VLTLIVNKLHCSLIDSTVCLVATVNQKADLFSQRYILVAVAGQTPAIVTETLWALEQQCGVRVDEIRVITTAQGAQSLIRELLGSNGAFAEYCTHYQVPAGRIAFSQHHIYVLKDAEGRELQDIRNSEDNKVVANTIFSLIRSWCRRSDEVLHCSVAGGRKTMGNYLTMSLMLCGRMHDRLSHVLVSPEFERGVHGFYYPPPRETFYARKSRVDNIPGEPLSSRDACVELADIPFPRLRELLGGDLPLEKSLTEAITYSQYILQYLQAPPPLILRLDRRSVILGQFAFVLPKQLIAVYAFFLLSFNGSRSRASMETLFCKRLLLAQLERLMDRMKHGEHEVYAWETMKDEADFRSRMSPCISKVNGALQSALGKNRLSSHFSIATKGAYGVDVQDFEILLKEGEPLTEAHLQSP